MLVALLLGAVATIVGVRAVADQIQETAAQPAIVNRRPSRSCAPPLTPMNRPAISCLSNAPADRSAFLQQQQDVSRRFEDAIRAAAG